MINLDRGTILRIWAHRSCAARDAFPKLLRQPKVMYPPTRPAGGWLRGRFQGAVAPIGLGQEERPLAVDRQI